MGVHMNVNFYERGGTNYVSIEDGHKLFEEAIIQESPNGKYCLAAGYWYINDENSENDGDEIDGSAETIIFEDGQIFYRAKSIEDAEDYAIRDDGKLCILEADYVSVWSASAKPIRKSFSFSWYDCGLNTDFAWACGDGEDGNLRLSVFIFETGKMWTKRLPAKICYIKCVIMVKDTQYRIHAVAEAYEDEDELQTGTTVLIYDADGKKQEITAEDLRKLLALLPPCEAGDKEDQIDDTVQIEEAPPAAQKPSFRGFLAKLFGK